MRMQPREGEAWISEFRPLIVGCMAVCCFGSSFCTLSVDVSLQCCVAVLQSFFEVLATDPQEVEAT